MPSPARHLSGDVASDRGRLRRRQRIVHEIARAVVREMARDEVRPYMGEDRVVQHARDSKP